MKICLLARFFDLRNAGIGRYSQELFRELSKKGELEIKTVSQDGGIPLGQGMLKYFAYTAFESMLKIPKVDVYHALTPLESMHVPNPLVVTFHDFIPLLHLDEISTHYASNKFEKWFTKNYFGIACSVAIKKADIITTVSEQTKQELKQNYDTDAIVIRHGIRQDFESTGKKDDVFRVGTLGFLGPRKRYDLLIKAFLEADVDGELVIGGSYKTNNREYQRLVRIANGDKRIKFLGFIPDSQLKYFYNSLSVLVLASKFEGYCLPAVEAMACKIPVITLSDALIPKDVVKKTMVVNKDNLAEVLGKQKFDCNVDLGYKFAREHSWTKVADKYLEIYQELISS